MQCIAKVYTFIFYRDRINEVLDMIENFHKQMRDPKTQAKLQIAVINSCLLKNFTYFCYLGVGIMILIYPLIFYLIVGRRTLHFGFVVPFLDAETDFGYWVNVVEHVIDVFYAVIFLYFSS